MLVPTTISSNPSPLRSPAIAEDQPSSSPAAPLNLKPLIPFSVDRSCDGTGIPVMLIGEPNETKAVPALCTGLLGSLKSPSTTSARPSPLTSPEPPTDQTEELN